MGPLAITTRSPSLQAWTLRPLGERNGEVVTVMVRCGTLQHDNSKLDASGQGKA